MNGIKNFDFFKGNQRYFWDIWIPGETKIVLGRFCDEKKDIKSQVYLDGINVERRVGGGGTVLLDDGVVLIEVGMRVNFLRPVSFYFNKFNSFISQTLNKFEIKSFTDPNWFDLRVGNRKIAGVSLALRKNLVIYGISIVLKNDTICKMEKYLEIPSKQPEYRKGRSHTEFMTSLESFNNFDLNEFLRILNLGIEDVIIQPLQTKALEVYK